MVRNLENHQHEPLKICVISLMELYYGAYKSKKMNANLAKVRRIEKAFDTIPVDFFISETFGMINPNVAKAGGLQSQGVKGEAVIGYRDPLTTRDLKSSSFPVRETK